MDSAICTGEKKILIIGNPNVGKTTLFNDLTGANEKIANYSGITTEITVGHFLDNFGHRQTLYDLPGTYGLSAYAPEEKEICELLFKHDASVRILCVLDADHLERNLFLGTQLLGLGLPICFVVTLSQVAQKNGHVIDRAALENILGVPFVFLNNSSRKRQLQLREIITQDRFVKRDDFSIDLPKPMEALLECLSKKTGVSKAWCEILLSQEVLQRKNITGDFEEDFKSIEDQLDVVVPHWKTQCIQARYGFIEGILGKIVSHVAPARIVDWDALFLHRLWGPVLTIFILISLLASVFSLSEYPIRWGEFFIQNVQNLIQSYLPNGWFKSLVCEGILGGVGNVLLFLPQFILMIAFMGILENTGYLARATFLLDRWMKKIGLSGPSFVALISCYACTIPGIMQTRCLHNREERLTTLFVAPWVNCSSRVPIYLLLITMLLPSTSPLQKSFILIAIYSLGLIAALLLAAFIRKFFLKTRNTVHVVEMPPLLRPQFVYIFQLVKNQTLIFLRKAGTYILCFSIVLWLCLQIKVTTSDTQERVDCIRWVGKKLEPVLKPIGFDWHIGISLLSSFGTRENFISTLGVLHNVDTKESGNCLLRDQLKRAVDENGHPIYSFATCISLILFFMFSLQCIGTFIFVKHETYSWRLTLLQFFFMNGFAYALCFLVYNLLK